MQDYLAQDSVVAVIMQIKSMAGVEAVDAILEHRGR